MGCYINPTDMSKEQWLHKHALPPRGTPDPITETHLPVCWVHNGHFTAAAIAYDARELARFSDWTNDHRPHLWFYAPRELLRTVSDLAAYEALSHANE